MANHDEPKPPPGFSYPGLSNSGQLNYKGRYDFQNDEIIAEPDDPYDPVNDIKNEELYHAIRKNIGDEFPIFLSDIKFLKYSINELKPELLSLNDYPEYEKHYFDCDDFTQVLLGAIKSKKKSGTDNQAKFRGIPLGIIWVYHRKKHLTHSVNIFYDGKTKQVWLIDPLKEKNPIFKFNKALWRGVLAII
ncbi:MAG: lectin MOA-related protein [Candidatus Aminicenantia bacterium]